MLSAIALSGAPMAPLARPKQKGYGYAGGNTKGRYGSWVRKHPRNCKGRKERRYECRHKHNRRHLRGDGKLY